MYGNIGSTEATEYRPLTLSISRRKNNLGKSIKSLLRVHLTDESALQFKVKKSYFGVTYSAQW